MYFISVRQLYAEKPYESLQTAELTGTRMKEALVGRRRMTVRCKSTYPADDIVVVDKGSRPLCRCWSRDAADDDVVAKSDANVCQQY